MTSILRAPIDFDTLDPFETSEAELAEIMASAEYSAWVAEINDVCFAGRPVGEPLTATDREADAADVPY